MASNHTANYNLNQWEATDKVLRTEFNEDNSKIDAALNGLAGQVAEKAAQSAVTALTQTVSGKADQSALNSLTQTVNGKANQAYLTAEISARTEADEALAAKAGTKLLSRVTLSAAADSFILDLSDVDWDQWATVTILVNPVQSLEGEYILHFNDGGEDFNWAFFKGPFLGVLFPYYDGDRPITALLYPAYDEEIIHVFDVSYSSLNHVTADARGGNLQAGTVAEAWGNK